MAFGVTMLQAIQLSLQDVEMLLTWAARLGVDELE